MDDDSQDPFALEENVLRVTSPLDYETKKNYTVAVRAIDSRGGDSIAKLFITISDVNGKLIPVSKVLPFSNLYYSHLQTTHQCSISQ